MSHDVRGRLLFRPTGPRLGAALLVCACLLANAWAGCTVTKSNYRTLSLFFDGVPDPEKAAGSVNPETGEVVPGVNVSIHPPYAQENCDECHKSRLRMTKNDSSICAKCHAGKEKEHERMHGPVAAQACLWCHTPHESAHKHLLRDADRALCGQCHVPALLNAERVPEHADSGRACLECHSGHGGSRPFMLLEAASKGGG